MAMMVAQVVEDVMAKVERTIVEHLAGGERAASLGLVDLLRSVHENRMLRAGEHHEVPPIRKSLVVGC
jgi:hypothetical protein